MTSAQRPVPMLVLFCFCAIAAVFVLRPDALQQREAGLSQMTPDEALSDLGGYVAYDREEQGIALIHAQLALEAGDFVLARQLLEDLATNFPEDASLKDLLAHTEELFGDPVAAADHLAAAYRLQPTRERKDRLGLLLRILGRHADEAALLTEAPLRDLTAAELDRAVELLLADGRMEDVERLYMELIEQVPGLADVSRRRLVAFLIDLGRSGDAYNMAISWMAQDPADGDLPAELVRGFIARGDIDHAVLVAENRLSSMPQGGGQIVLRFAETGHGALARSLQATWLSNTARLSDDDWSDLSRTAALTGDLSGLRNALARQQAPTPEVLGEALLQFLRYFGSQALLPYRSYRSRELSEATPLVGAAFALEMSHPEEAARWLAIANADSLGAWDRAVWQALADRLSDTGVSVAGGIAPQ